jgi:hypothetical protein
MEIDHDKLLDDSLMEFIGRTTARSLIEKTCFKFVDFNAKELPASWLSIINEDEGKLASMQPQLPFSDSYSKPKSEVCFMQTNFISSLS